MTETTLRAFIAVPLPEAAKRYLGELQDRLRRHTGAHSIRWVGIEGIHLTLKFLGATPTANVGPIAASLDRLAADAASFSLHLGQLGVFPSFQRPRVVWIGLTGTVEPLAGLARAVGSDMASEGFPPESRAYSPHVTLGRMRQGAPPLPVGELERALADAAQMGTGPVLPVERIVLFRSTLTPAGAIHEELAGWRLGREFQS